jgi:hypothetical protein
MYAELWNTITATRHGTILDGNKQARKRLNLIELIKHLSEEQEPDS